MRKKYRLHFAIVLLLDIVSALSARYAFESGSTLFLILSMVSLSMAGYFFIKLMQEEVGIVVNITWVALGTINVTVASWLAFGEKISWMQGLAMAVIVTGLTLMEYCAPDEEPAKEAVKTQAIIEAERLEKGSSIKIESIGLKKKKQTSINHS